MALKGAGTYMNGHMDTQLGRVSIDPEVIATYAGSVAVECFGIVGMAAVNMKDGLVKLLKKDYLQDLISELKKHGELSIITDVVYIYDTLKEHNDMVTYNDNSKISLCNKYSLETHLNRLLSKKVWLKSGAYLIIEPTEALTVIDVNTGKADLKTNKESTFKKINLEAAKEIALQMKLRNISGIIIVDFINMSNNKDYDILTHEMSEYLTNDFSISNVVDITKLGLMELTRKKKEKSLEEIVNEKKDDN